MPLQSSPIANDVSAGFGEYNCSKCKNKWKSTASYEDVGQRCRQCKTIVTASKHRVLKTNKTPKKHTKTEEDHKLKGIGPFFADFNCQKCKKGWPSAYAWFDDDEWTKLPQKCNRCHVSVYPQNMRKLEKTELEGTKPHKVELCGKCKKLGYSCEELKKETQGLMARFGRLRV